MRSCAVLIGLVIVVALPVAAQTDATAAAANLIRNPSFEDAVGDAPKDWETSKWDGAAEFRFESGGRTGRRSVAVQSSSGADAAWSTEIDVEPGARYRLSGWVRTENVVKTTGRGALINIHGGNRATKALVGTNDWTRLELEFDAGEDDLLTVNCLFGGWGQATGKAVFDDLELSLLSRGTTESSQAPTIKIDAGRRGEPISPFIYGQFIEHLGRCIYGGIWAEMLEDRKFSADIRSPDSPWRPIGGVENVAMIREDAYAADFAPRLTLTRDGGIAGLKQGGLGVVAGKKYVGYAVVKVRGELAAAEVLLAAGSESAKTTFSSTNESTVGEYVRRSFEFVAPQTSDDATIELTFRGEGTVAIGAVSLMPDDNVEGFRRDTLELLKKLDAPVYRWPGGNFVSGYSWQDGIGPRDLRPPRKNPAWRGIDSNDVGTDEFLRLCALLATEPYIAVNSGQGDALSAAEWVEYVNGAPSTRMGLVRAMNGRFEPHRVKYWSIGNEMFGSWQIGYMPVENYAKKHNVFAAAMRTVDPTIRLIGVGAVGRWDEYFLGHCADATDFVSEHIYWQKKRQTTRHIMQVPRSIRELADAHRRYRATIPALAKKDIRICFDEWNYWYGPEVFGELGTRYFMKDALGIAAGIHEMARQSDLYFMANYAQTVNVIGAIKTSKTAAAMETTGWTLALYRKHFGTVPLATSMTGAIDAQATLSADGDRLILGVVNTKDKAARIPLEILGAKIVGSGPRREIAHPDPDAFNDPGKADRVAISETSGPEAADAVDVAAHSITIFEWRIRR